MEKLFYHEITKCPRLNIYKGLTGQAKTRKKEKFRVHAAKAPALRVPAFVFS